MYTSVGQLLEGPRSEDLRHCHEAQRDLRQVFRQARRDGSAVCEKCEIFYHFLFRILCEL